MSYREQWVVDVLGGRHVPSLALDIHMTAVGSMDRSVGEEVQDVKAAQSILSSWEPSEIKFDGLVKLLLEESVREHFSKAVPNDDVPSNSRQIPRVEFDNLARARAFVQGPFISSFGDSEFEPYLPPANRTVWGMLVDGPVFSHGQ